MKPSNFLSVFILGVSVACGLSGCVTFCSEDGKRSHALIGAWKASDATIFVFRDDGTFHGLDWRKREIWGNWVELSPNRIGFQSLRHDSFYRPQYAVIGGDKESMDYIVTGGTSFIHSERIPIKEAYTIIERTLRDVIILPGQETTK